MIQLDGVVDEIRARVAEAEETRRIPTATVDQLKACGVFRALQPARYGGLEVDPMSFYEAVRDIASACGSTGWVASILGVHAWQLALFPDQAQADVWGADPDTLIRSRMPRRAASTRSRAGIASPAAGTSRLVATTREWVFLGGAVLDADGQPIDFGTVLLPRSDYVIDDVWDTVGLRGTGSNDIVVDDAFVPAHRFLSFADTSRCQCPGQAMNTAAAVSVAVRVGVLQRDHRADHRHGARRLRRPRRDDERARAHLIRRSVSSTTDSRRSGWRGRRARSTRLGCNSSETSRELTRFAHRRRPGSRWS